MGKLIRCISEDGTLTVLGARQTAPHRIEIPTEICGRRVAAIAPKAFRHAQNKRKRPCGHRARGVGQPRQRQRIRCELRC